MYRIGIDVGGTNTDAIILDENYHLVHAVKSPTSLDIKTGIETSFRNLSQESNMDKTQITHAMLGTTQCTNAIVERKSWPKSASFVWVTRQPLPLRRTRPGLRTWFSRCRVNMLSFMADMNMTAKCLEKSMKLKLKLF